MLHIADYNSDDGRVRIVTLSIEGDECYVYFGHREVNSCTPFIPVSIMTTERENVVVSDIYTKTLHFLDYTGKLMTFCNKTNIGIDRPYSLAFKPSSNSLYQGC